MRVRRNYMYLATLNRSTRYLGIQYSGASAIRTAIIRIGLTVVHCLCHDHHCYNFCTSGKFECVSHDHENHGCHCYPADYCDDVHYHCSPLHCPHNEPTRCNGHNKCECYCSQDSHCQNCPEQGFCINEQCVCESNNYCPGGNQYYCLKNFNCQHDESKRCNSNDRCECFCNQDTECKNCPEKGFCVDGQCVCESHDFCPKGNPLYCMYLDPTCSLGFTAKCNGSNHCYCAYVPDTCSGHDVSTCFHLKCRPGEKKFCEGRTCICKPLDYCEKGDADCGHLTCDASLGEVRLCGTNNTCQCLAIPDFCGGSDTSTCTHIKCNQYQVKVCDNGMCKCQLNPSCDSNLGLNHTCTAENTVLELKENGTKSYKNCTDDNLFPICVDGRCQCIFWKTPSPPPSTTTKTPLSPIITSPTLLSTIAQTSIPTTVDANSSVLTTPTATASTTTVPTTTAAAACNSRDDCNQGNTFMIFPGWQMPCPVDHIDCHNDKCYCSPDRVTTSPPPTTPTTTVAPISCHQCGDRDSNLPCDLRKVYMGSPSPCSQGKYCMTDVVQGADDSVAIYKRCVDELTCRNEWLAQTSDQDRCLKYAEGALPGQYTCHYCCTADGCNSKIVPEAKYFYSTSSSNIN